MRDETRKKIEGLYRLPWFHNVGHAVRETVRVAKSWAEAMHHCKAIEWQSVQIQVNNLLGIRVNQTDYSRFQSWNSTVVEIKTKLERVLNEYVDPISAKQGLPPRFRDSVEWDLIEICIETEVADICQPIFFLERVLPWYEAGHFPCGWDGPKLSESREGLMPEGRLIVY